MPTSKRSGPDEAYRSPRSGGEKGIEDDTEGHGGKMPKAVEDDTEGQRKHPT